MIRYGLDVSNYTGIPSHESLMYLRQRGYDWAIVGTQIDQFGNNYTIPQTQALGAAFMHVLGTYELMYFDGYDNGRFAHAASFGLPVWVDCEESVNGLSSTQVVQAIQAIVNQLGGMCAGIYTRGSWWIPNTGNSHVFAYLPLWNADYRAFTFDDWNPYGGWHRPVLWQYANHTLNEVNADSNAWEFTPVTGPLTPGLPDPDVITVPNPEIIPAPQSSQVMMILLAALIAGATFALLRPNVVKKIIVKDVKGRVSIAKAYPGGTAKAL